MRVQWRNGNSTFDPKPFATVELAAGPVKTPVCRGINVVKRGRLNWCFVYRSECCSLGVITLIYNFSDNPRGRFAVARVVFSSSALKTAVLHKCHHGLVSI